MALYQASLGGARMMLVGCRSRSMIWRTRNGAAAN